MLLLIEDISERLGREDAIAAHADAEPDGRDEPGGDDALTEAERAALARLNNGEPLTPEDDAVLERLGNELCGPMDYDFGTCPAEEYYAWLADLATAASEAGPGSAADDLLDAGFTHRSATGGIGFAGGGVLDRMDAGWLLAKVADLAWDRLDRMSDDELVGLAQAQRRLASRAVAGELAALGQLAARRARPDGVPGEHVDDEVAALLTLTGPAAARRVALAEAMTRLPAVAEALAVGQIDVDKAQVFADELIVVDDDPAAAEIAARLIPAAPEKTTGELRHKLRQEIGHFDPEAARRRKEKARKDARVDVWIDADGTGAIAVRGMDPAAAIVADQNLDADARWLQAHGTPGTLDQLRVAVVAARLSHQPLHSLLPQPSATDSGAGSGAGAAGAGTAGAYARNGANGPGGDGPGADGPGAVTRAAGAGMTGAGAGSAGAHSPASLGGWAGGLGGLGGSVNLTMPADAWLGRSDNPGEVARYGVIDADTCRDLAEALASSGRTRWCITLVDRNGRAVAHGCARAGPGPPGSDRAAWLAAVEITPIETGTCSHRRESAGYRPSPSLRHIVKVRSPRCGFPGCRRRAQRCDDDHTVPYHKGGKSCECNLYPLCRTHHRVKQAPGWRLAQPEPGILIWTLPSGRRVTVTAEPYPV
jgi:Domain of unknown function (DUF222)